MGCLFGVVVIAGCWPTRHRVMGKVVTKPELTKSSINILTGSHLPEGSIPVEDAEFIWSSKVIVTDDSPEKISKNGAKRVEVNYLSQLSPDEMRLYDWNNWRNAEFPRGTLKGKTDRDGCFSFFVVTPHRTKV